MYIKRFLLNGVLHWLERGCRDGSARASKGNNCDGILVFLLIITGVYKRELLDRSQLRSEWTELSSAFVLYRELGFVKHRFGTQWRRSGQVILPPYR